MRGSVQATNEARKCVTLATRPLILSILKQRLCPSQTGEKSLRRLAGSVRALLETSSSSAMKSIRILTVLLEQDLLGKFDHQRLVTHTKVPYTESFTSFDLECISSAATLYILARFLAPDVIPNDPSRKTAIFRILDSMIACNSRPAEIRKADLHRLETSIHRLRAADTQDNHEGGSIDHDAHASSAHGTDSANLLQQPIDTYTLPFSENSTGDERHDHLNFAPRFDNMETLGPDQLLEIASLFDRAPQYLDETGFDTNQSWLWSN